MENIEFSTFRRYLGKTQKQLAGLLNVSPRAVQSFEQGWRNIPTHIERDMLLFISLKRMPFSEIDKPCWEIKNCPGEWRRNCFVWEIKARHFCWFINGSFCDGESRGNWEKKMKLCRQCKVFRATFPTG
ncbi:two-CW domain-containing protein [Chloroflexota bacterium]